MVERKLLFYVYNSLLFIIIISIIHMIRLFHKKLTCLRSIYHGNFIGFFSVNDFQINNISFFKYSFLSLIHLSNNIGRLLILFFCINEQFRYYLMNKSNHLTKYLTVCILLCMFVLCLFIWND